MTVGYLGRFEGTTEHNNEYAAPLHKTEREKCTPGMIVVSRTVKLDLHDLSALGISQHVGH